MALLNGLTLLLRYLPAIGTIADSLKGYVKPGNKYDKNRVIFVIIMFVILLGSVTLLGEVNTQVALDALEQLCDTVDCD